MTSFKHLLENTSAHLELIPIGGLITKCRVTPFLSQKHRASKMDFEEGCSTRLLFLKFVCLFNGVLVFGL